MKLLTIGGYGFNEQTFIRALKDASVDTLVDIRQRRGLRGSQYAFLNRARLEPLVDEAQIRYVYLKALAPTTEIRSLQRSHDLAHSVAKRVRQQLSPEFVEAYKRQILALFSASAFLSFVGNNTETAALFCVETQPLACHRTLAAEYLAKHLGLSVGHLIP